MFKPLDNGGRKDVLPLPKSARSSLTYPKWWNGASKYEKDVYKRLYVKDPTQEDEVSIKDLIDRQKLLQLELKNEQLQTRIDIDRGDLAQVQEFIRVIEHDYTQVKQHLITIPGKLARRLTNQADPNEVKKILDKEMNDTATVKVY